MAPLSGLRVVQMAGLAPGPFTAMMLADLGADVVRVDRVSSVRVENPGDLPLDVLGRGNRSIGVDIKSEAGVAVVRRLIRQADVFLEGFRPGVAERLGLGPDALLAENPNLVYGRMTGWGQSGPLAEKAGHDINYLAISGVLSTIGRADEPPVPPINLVADMGGGGMLLLAGVLAALIERQRTRRGQVVDAAMVDGSALLMAPLYGLLALGRWDGRESNIIDGGAPGYRAYETADGRYVAVGAEEREFYENLVERLGLDDDVLAGHKDKAAWPEVRERIAAVFRTRTRDEWVAAFADTDACFSPVMEMGEAMSHAHNESRGTFAEIGGVAQPAPAPLFDGDRLPEPKSAPAPGRDTDAVLAEAGFAADEIAKLRASKAIA